VSLFARSFWVAAERARWALVALVAVWCHALPLGAAEDPPEYSAQVLPILRKHCFACHDAKEANGKLVMESFASLMKGGENGAPIVAGDPDKSLLIRLVERKAEPFMPPDGETMPTAAEVAVLRAWVKAGAKPPKGDAVDPAPLKTPKIAVTGKVRRAVNAVAWSPDDRFVAIGRGGTVEIQSADGKPVRTLDGHTGSVNDLAISRDGSLLAAASGEAGLFGELSLWKTATWEKAATLRGHKDSIYAVDISPDGALVATGSYDQKIVLWDVAAGKPLREAAGHNGAVHDLAFHPTGTILASASSDRTVKLWDVATGNRLDTLGQPEKDQYAVAFSPDGRFIAAGGVDNRLRIWELRQMGKEGTSPLVYSRFAHEAAILRIAFSRTGGLLVTSGEDRAVKFWETRSFTPLKVLKDQPDWAVALAVSPNERTLLAGRLDGSVERIALDGLGGREGVISEPVTRIDIPETPPGTPMPKLPEITESEPNDAVDRATPLSIPGTVHGVFNPVEGAAKDVDLYRIDAKAGQVWIVETNAGRRNSPADTRIEILHADGTPVLRHLLRAVRDSIIEFRPIDSSQDQVRVKNWEEMELNQFLYMNGEVGKFHRMPEGPDSGFWFYTVGGKRRCWFDTSPIIHALDETVYIVEAHPPGATLIDNGLPVFRLNYANDDDAERKLGSDSKLTFTAPADGAYLIKATDARGFSGKEYVYSLTVREPRPDFNVTVAGKGATVPKGSGQKLTFTVERTDGYNGAVRIDVAGLPPGFTVATPVVVEEGHLEARGMIHAAPDAAAPSKEAWDQVTVTATATIAGQPVSKPLGNLGEIKLADKPKVLVTLELDPAAGSGDGANEIVIEPGRRTTAIVRAERNGAAGDLRFDVDNLPHGVVVDDLGLNGITLLPGQTERRIFFTARPWVGESTRLVYAICRSEGNQTSLPVTFRVKGVKNVAALPAPAKESATRQASP